MWHQMLNQFHFQQPLWLLLIVPLVGLSYLGWRGGNGRSHWNRVCDPELLPLLVREGRASSKAGLGLALLVSLLLALAAAQPVWQKQPRPAYKQGGAVVIALDLSASMNATDVKPSRLQRARFKIEDLLGRLGDSQVALLVYAGDAFAVTPLTEDSDTVRAQLPAMVPEIMPAQGSRADRALQQAADMLQQAGVQGGDILLVSDEVEPAQVAAVMSRLRQQGVKTSILAVGSEQGAPIPTTTGPLKDSQGRVILAKTSLAQISEAAALGGGQAVRMSHDDSDLSRLVASFDRGERLRQETATEVDHWVAEGPWLALLILPLMLPLFRRGLLNLLLPVVLVVSFSHARPVLAAEAESETGLWQQLWQTDDQRAARHYAAGDRSAAAAAFSDPRWKQLAQYENGDYDAALESLAAPESAADWYNRGNILARKGQLETAIAAYDKALALQPDHADAAHNKQLLEQLQAQQKQQQQPDQNQQDQNQQGQNQQGQKQPGDQQEPSEDQASNQPSSPEEDSGDQSQQSESSGTESQSEQAQSGQSQAGQSQAGQSQSKAESSAAAQSSAASAAEKQQAEQAAEQLRQSLDQQLDQKQPASEEVAGQALAESEAPLDEAEQARQQLLNRIVDDPAGLWRRKFIYQYRQRTDQPSAEEKQW